MKTSYWFSRFSLPHAVLSLALLCGATAQSKELVAVQRIQNGIFLNSRIVEVGDEPSTDEEARLLLTLLSIADSSQYTRGLDELESYLQNRTNSPWGPSLHAALGKHYREIGRYTLALEHWQIAWEMTQGYSEGNGKKVGDFVLAHWTRLLAMLGRYETLTELVQQNRSRVLDRGPLSQRWARTREAVEDMRRNPGHSYQCGTFAVNSVARELRMPYDAKGLLNIPSPESGFKMGVLAQITSQLNLGLMPVLRVSGESIPVPSVVHWKQNHYAAIVERRGGLYKVVDPTFGNPRLMAAETINAEASGAFMIPSSQATSDFRFLDVSEANQFVGRGNANFLGDESDQPCECPTSECPIGPGGTGSGGPGDGPATDCNSCGANAASFAMPTWGVSEPYINIWLRDQPLAYQPALGGRFSFDIMYKQRTDDSVNYRLYASSSVGWNWSSPWTGFIYSEYERYGLVTAYNGGGGVSYYNFAPGQIVTSNYFNTKQFSVFTNADGTVQRFEFGYPDGARDVFGFAPTNVHRPFATYYYLSQKIDANGHATTFQYDDFNDTNEFVRLMFVIDPDGGTNIIAHGNVDIRTNLITQVTDPFGRYTYLQYDDDGLLTNITDIGGMSSSMIYDQNGWVTNLTTPYGTTRFYPVDKGQTVEFNWDRNVTIVEPNGSKQLYAFIQGAPFEIGTYPGSEIPTNTPIGTLDNDTDARNSYHWGRLQYAGLSSTNWDDFTTADYLKARMRHWLGATVHGEAYRSMDTLSMERMPSQDGTVEGQKTWYDYPNKGYYGPGDKGDHILPGVAARVLPDGSTWYQWKQRNQFGTPTQVVETYTTPGGTIGLRTNIYIYAANGVNLLQQIGPQGEQVVSNYFNNVYHQPDRSYDALNQETIYSYNGNRQLISVVRPTGLTTTNIYFLTGAASNRLQMTIDLEINRTNSYTYYVNGLLCSQTDERGLTTTNYWDNLLRLTGVRYPDATTTSNRYTALDITARKDRLGYWTYTGFNEIRQVVTETNANGVATRYGLCECGAILSVTNAWNTSAQMVTSFGYDNQGNRIYTYLPDMTVTNWFDAMARPLTACDAWGCRWFYYNNQGLRVAVTNAFGAEQIAVYDIEDRPQYVTDANNVTITNTYDDLGRLRTRGYPDGGVEKFGYSARGLIAYTNQLGFTNFYVYDAAGRKLFETNANFEVIRYTNNAAGDLLALVDGKNQVTKWKYDEYGQVTNKLDQAATEILRYTYDADGRLTSRWSAAKGATYYTNDAVGNLIYVNYPASIDVVFAYDAMNRMTNMTDVAGTTKYAYTSAGRLRTEDGPFASDTLTNVYFNGLRTNLTLQQPAGVWTNRFAYDSAKRLTNVTSPAGSFNYYLAGTGPASPSIRKIALPNTSYVTNTYDGVARLTGTWLNKNDDTTLDSAMYAYNLGNQRINFTNAAGTYVTNTYDRIGQLRDANSSVNAEDRGYTYDAAWNLNSQTINGTPQTFSVNNKNELTGVPGGSPQYDANGNMTTDGLFLSYFYDAENRLVAVQWDEAGAGSEPEEGSWRTEFLYDGLGRLRQRLEYSYSAGPEFDFALSINYIYDGMRVIQERDSSNVPTVSYTRGTDLSGSLEGAGGIGGLLARSDFTPCNTTLNINITNHSGYCLYDLSIYDAYGTYVSGASIADGDTGNYSFTGVPGRTYSIYGSSCDFFYIQVISHSWAAALDTYNIDFEDIGGGGGGVAHPDESGLPLCDAGQSGYWLTHNYYHADGNGNVTYMESSSQTLSASYRYDPFGNTISQSGSMANANVYRFSSKEIHGNSGLYYYGYRWYSPNLQRWLTRDPIHENGGLNLYNFVSEDPINFVDTMGLKKDPACVAWCNKHYGMRVSSGSMFGAGYTAGTWPKPDQGLKGRMTRSGGGLTKYGRSCFMSAGGILLGLLEDNVHEDGFFALMGCVSGCPEVPDCPWSKIPWGQNPVSCNANNIAVVDLGPRPPEWNFPRPYNK